MIKGISAITNLGKRSATIAMLAGAITLGTNAITKQSQTGNNTTPTELISKDAANALKANAIVQITQDVPSTHNYKLDKTLRKFTESKEDRIYFNNFLSNIYEQNGTFLGSALTQLEIDIQMLYAFVTKRADLLIKKDINPELGKTIQGFGPKFYNTVEPHKESLTNWMITSYPETLGENLTFDKKPSAEEVCKRLDYIVDNKAGFTKLEKSIYYMNSDAYIKQHMKNKDTQSMSDFIAYKMYLIDSTIMEKSLGSVGVLGMGRFENGKMSIKDYYQMWMESVDPSIQ